MPAVKLLGQTRHQRQNVRFQRRQHRLAAVLGHDVVETWKLCVRNAAALLEAFDDLVFDAAQERNVLREHGQIVRARRPRQKSRMLGGQENRFGRGIDLDDPAGDHRAQPLAHVALIEPGLSGDLRGRRRRRPAHRIEQTGAMADRDHQAQRAVVERAQ